MANRQLELKVVQDGQGQFSEERVDFARTPGNRLPVGTADPGNAGDFLLGGNIDVVVVPVLVADGGADRPAGQLPSTKTNLASQHQIEEVQFSFNDFVAAPGDGVHHVDRVVVFRVHNEEGAVAGVAVIDDVAIQALDHRADVVVLVRHEDQFPVGAGECGVAFPALEERHIEVRLDGPAAQVIDIVGKIVAIRGMAIGPGMGLVDRPQPAGHHVFIQRNPGWIQSAVCRQDRIHQAIVVDIMHTPVRQAVTVCIHREQRLAHGVHRPEWVARHLTPHSGKFTDSGVARIAGGGVGALGEPGQIPLRRNGQIVAEIPGRVGEKLGGFGGFPVAAVVAEIEEAVRPQAHAERVGCLIGHVILALAGGRAVGIVSR